MAVGVNDSHATMGPSMGPSVIVPSQAMDEHHEVFAVECDVVGSSADPVKEPRNSSRGLPAAKLGLMTPFSGLLRLMHQSRPQRPMSHKEEP